MNKVIPSKIAFLVIIVVAVVVTGLVWLATIDRRSQIEMIVQSTASQTQNKACPEDAKICPDGTVVGKIGPNCEFAKCPVDETVNKNELSNFNGWESTTSDCMYDGLEYMNPRSWFDEDFSYLSSTEIEYFGKYGREPNNAAVRQLDLVEDSDPNFQEANYMTRLFSEYTSEIENAQRKNADEEVIIAGKKFKKYDLINFREYNGKDYGNVIIFLSPVFSHNNREVNFAFEWHEYPGGQKIKGNSKDIFLGVVSSINFTGKKCDKM